MSEAHGFDRSERPPGARPARAPRADRVAILALVLSVTVVFSLPAVLVALLAVGRARRAGRPVPGTAIGAIAVSLVSLGMVVVMVLAYGYGRARDQLRAFLRVQPVEVRDELTQHRYSATLDKDTACKLVEQQLSQNGFAGAKPEDFVAVHCDGELEAGAQRARLGGVRAQFMSSEVVVNGCLLRQARWFVHGVTRHECVQPLDLPDPPADDAAEVALAAYEKKVRQASEQARDAVAVQGVTQKLQIVRNAVAGLGALSEKKCDDDAVKRLASVDGMALETVDLGLYAAPDKPRPQEPPPFDAGVSPDGGTLRPVPWRWMTSERMRRLSGSDSALRRQAAREFDELQGSLLVVYRAESRDWPEFVPKWGPNHQYMFTKGGYRGWMIVFDLERAEPLCQVRLQFVSSDEVNATRLGLMPETTGFSQMLDHDMHTRFQESATAALKRIAPALSLGYMATEAP